MPNFAYRRDTSKQNPFLAGVDVGPSNDAVEIKCVFIGN